jgi:PAS domain S-box-containing protein
VVYTADLEGRFTSINRAGERLSGYTREEVLALRIEDIAVPEIRPVIRQQLAERFQGKEIPPVEMQILTKTGRRVDVEVSNRVVYADNQPVGLQGIARDITARKRAEEALRQAEQKYHSIFDNAVEGIFQKSREGFYLSLNPALASMHGFPSPADMLEDEANLQSAQYMDVRRRSEYQKSLERDGAVSNFEYEIQRRDGGRIWVSENTRAVRDAQGRLLHYEGSLVDITERRQLEDQYRQAQKMESVGQLAAGVAHDFNNLLTIIQGYTALINASLPTTSEHADGLKQIAEASRRAANLTRQLLAFSRRQVMRPEAVRLNDVITNLTKMLHPLLGDDIALQFTYAPGLPMVYADVSMLEQVLMNLAVNARDAMPKGGRLLIQTDCRQIDAAYVAQNPEANPGPHVCMSVIDTGCGMDAATMNRLFEPFFTTKEVGKGSGLGLATVYGIIKQHKGWVEVISEVGCGSTFKVFLPAHADLVEERPLPVVAPSGNLSGTETILLVEDEPALRGLTRRVLQKSGYRVIEAASGMEAESVWRRHNDRINLLLTDIVMPDGISGRDLAERLQAEDSQLKVLYTSGYSRDIVGKDFMLHEDISFLPKPYRPAALARAVRECLDGRTPHVGA